MPDYIHRDDVAAASGQLGYEVFSARDDMTIYRRVGEVLDGPPYYAVVFTGDVVLWPELERLLRYEGIDPAAFRSALED